MELLWRQLTIFQEAHQDDHFPLGDVLYRVCAIAERAVAGLQELFGRKENLSPAVLCWELARSVQVVQVKFLSRPMLLLECDHRNSQRTLGGQRQEVQEASHESQEKIFQPIGII